MEKRVYKNIFDLVKHLRDDTPSSPLVGDSDAYEWVDYRDFLDESYEWIDCGFDQTGGRLMPSMHSPYLYRGQTEQHSRCYPKVYRDFPPVNRPRELKEEYRTMYLSSQIRILWFISLLKEHPAMEHARQFGIQINPIALAQHYGIPTHYLDLTQSIDVAAFFAWCKSENKVWQPVDRGQGVIYRFCWVKIPEAWKMIEVVGLLTFPRPGEQKAWVVPIRLGGNFEKVPHVETFTFKHTLEGSTHFFDMFDSGKALFPEDPAADIADSIMSITVIPTNFVVHTLLQFGCAPFKLEETFKVFQGRLLCYCNLTVENEVPIALTKEQLEKLAAYWSKREKDFLRNVGVHAVKIIEKGEMLTQAEAVRLLGISRDSLKKRIIDGTLVEIGSATI